jgi:hypothetical protein
MRPFEAGYSVGSSEGSGGDAKSASAPISAFACGGNADAGHCLYGRYHFANTSAHAGCDDQPGSGVSDNDPGPKYKYLPAPEEHLA